MERKSQNQLEDNFIDQKLAEAFGYQDEQLAKELDAIAAEAGDDLPRAPGGELEKIMNRLEYEESAKASRRKVVRMRRMVKILVAAAVLGTMVIGGGMWTGARRYNTYDSRERSDFDDVIVFNNNENNLVEDSESEEKESYRKIRDELNIEALELTYLPENFVFDDLTLWKSKALMKYTNGVSDLFFFQTCNDKSSSVSYAYNMTELIKLYNEYLGIEIPIYQQKLEDGGTEYDIRIVYNNTYYILHGEMEESDFIQVVEGLKKFGE